MMKSKKTLKPIIALLLAVALMSTAYIGVAQGFINGQSTVAPALADYITFEGTAASDSYSSRQYSYQINQWAEHHGLLGQLEEPVGINPGNVSYTAAKSIRVGMTEFGEFATPSYTGIAYGANAAEFAQTESWASTAIQQAYMVQGWVLYLNYSRFYVPRQIQAYALYSDAISTEAARKVYSWDGNTVLSSSTTLTAGYLTTGGIQVLYDSSRLGVARTTVMINDGFYHEYVAGVTYTIILDKTTKYMIVYKDVKMVLDPKMMIQIYELVFQEKYEIDLARNVNPGNGAYIHYYANQSESVYKHPLTGTNTIDVIQAFDPQQQYLWFAAYWPNATEFSVTNALIPTLPTFTNDFATTTRILPEGTRLADIVPNEPNTPVVTVQWRYNYTTVGAQQDYPKMLEFLAKSANREIRFVEIIGMTDFNNKNSNIDLQARDHNQTAHLTDQLDIEVQYLLDSVFNPEDLSEVACDAPLWVAVGQGSAATDSEGAAAVAPIWGTQEAPLGLFDTADSNHLGTIPYGLAPVTPGPYAQWFSNSPLTGTDTTSYHRFGLINFAFGTYDDVAHDSPQPIAGGFSGSGTLEQQSLQAPITGRYWYPSMNPLTDRWSYIGTAWTQTPYAHDLVDWNPNGIISIGGMAANGVARYFNDFNFAIDREGTSSSNTYALVNNGIVTGNAPTSAQGLTTVDFFPLSTWNTSSWNALTQTSIPVTTYGYGAGTAILSIARDNNGTRGISVAGWDARDTYWASAWASQYLGKEFNDWIPEGTVSVILSITYSDADHEPTQFTIARALGTITEFGTNQFTISYLTFDVSGHSYTGDLTWTVKEAISGTTLLPTDPYCKYDSQWWFDKLPTRSTALVQFDS